MRLLGAHLLIALAEGNAVRTILLLALAEVAAHTGGAVRCPASGIVLAEVCGVDTAVYFH